MSSSATQRRDRPGTRTGVGLHVLARRLAAGVVDLGLATLCSVAVALFVAKLAGGPTRIWQITALNMLALVLVAMVATLPTLGYAYLWQAGRSTPGHAVFGLTVRSAATGAPLSRLSSVSRWVALYGPIALWTYPVAVATVFDPGQLLMLRELPVWPFLVAVVPTVWYVTLAISLVLDRSGRQALHDRLARSVVISRTAAER